MHTQYKKGDHVEVEYLNYRMTGTVVGHRMIDDEDEPLTLVQLDTQRASTVGLLPYKIIGLTGCAVCGGPYEDHGSRNGYPNKHAYEELILDGTSPSGIVTRYGVLD